MEPRLPKGWKRDSDTVYIHATGVCIRLMTYRNKEGWMLVPADIDQAVVPFDPTPEGREQAFEAFAKGVLGRLGKEPSRRPTRVRKAKAAAAKAEETEEGRSEDDDEGPEDEKEEERDAAG